MRISRLLMLVAAAGTLACSGDGYGSGPTSCSPTATQVCTAGGNAFNPVARTVAAGTTVTWINGDGVGHTVTNDPGSTETFNLSLGSGGMVTHQFNNAGTYTYYCTIHGLPGTGMHGTITVN